MKLNPDAVAAAKEMRPFKGKSGRYGRVSVFKLEEIDFDNAIAILQDLNKRAKVKEWKLAKGAFKAGDYKESCSQFLDTLKNDACGRADTFTRESILRTIKKNFQDGENFSHIWMQVLSHPFENLKSAEEDVERYTRYMEKSLARVAIVEDFIASNDIEKCTEEYLEALKEQMFPKGERNYYS